MAATEVKRLTAEEAAARLPDLAEILVDAVAHGASVNFMAGFTHDEAAEFWHRQLPSLASGDTRLFVGDDGARLVGTTLLFFAPQPNAPHRADLGKMLVHSSLRRQGLGRRLLAAAEESARAAGRTLLLLDTESGSTGDLLYRSCGWVEIGRVPDHAYRPDGRLAATTMYYKSLTGGGTARPNLDRAE